MINISQHAFVPRTRPIIGKYYGLNGDLMTYPSVSTTLRQSSDVYNSFQFFGSRVPNNYYVMRMLGRNGNPQLEGVGVGIGNASGYAAPTLQTTQSWYDSSAFTFETASYTKGLPVLCVMWYQTPSPVLNKLGLGSISPDVMDDEEVGI